MECLSSEILPFGNILPCATPFAHNVTAREHWSLRKLPMQTARAQIFIYLIPYFLSLSMPDNNQLLLHVITTSAIATCMALAVAHFCTYHLGLARLFTHNAIQQQDDSAQITRLI